jgi:hypothetical protein
MAITKSNAKPAPESQLVSMAPRDFQVGGGGINDIDANITDVQACTFDWGGQAPANTPALCVEFTDDNGGEHPEYFSLGKGEDWEPSEDGRGFIAKSGKTSIIQNTNLGMFLESLVENGFPEETLAGGDLKCIIGTRVHVIRKTLERQGLIRTGKNAAKVPTVLVVDKVYSLPGAGGSGGVGRAGAGKPATAAAPKSPASASATRAAAGGKANGAATTSAVQADDLDTHIITALTLAVGESEGPMPVKNIAKVVFNYFNENSMKELANKAVARANKQELRQSLNDNGFVYDGATLVAAE